MTISELLDLNDDQLLAALQGALERASTDEAVAAARVVKLAKAIAALDERSPVVEKISAYVGIGDLTTGRAPLPRAAKPKPVTPAKRAPRGGPCSCEGCGKEFLAPAGLGSHKRFCRGDGGIRTSAERQRERRARQELMPALALASMPDVEATTQESRHPSIATRDSYFECSSCRTTFTHSDSLTAHIADLHSRAPRPAELVAIPA